MKKFTKKFVLMFCLTVATATVAMACTKEESYTGESSASTVEDMTTTGTETTYSGTEDETLENKVSEIKSIVMKLCGNEEHRFYAENSLGKGLQSEIISMADIIADRIRINDLSGIKTDINNSGIDEYGEINLNICLFRDKVWNEVTADFTKKREEIDASLDLGYIRIFNGNGEEFILAKSTNGAVYKVNDNVRYFQWFETDGTPANAETFCDLWYDELAGGGYHNLINVVTDDNENKTREELAYDLMEAYRRNSSTFLDDNAYYFTELKII